ncbi:MAG: hypothetical protein QXR31_01505 [Zestosphaera sp.]
MTELYRWKEITDRNKAMIVFANALLKSPKYYLGISSRNIPFIDVDSKRRICSEDSRYFKAFIRWIKGLLDCKVAVIRTDRGYHIIPLTELVNVQELIDDHAGKIGELMRELKTLLCYDRESCTLSKQLTINDIRSNTPLFIKLKSKAPADIRDDISKIVERITWNVFTMELLSIGETPIPAGKKLVMLRRNYIKVDDRLYPTFEEFYRIIQRFKKTPFPLRYHWVFAKKCVDDAFVDLSIKYHKTTLRISGKRGKPYDLKYVGVY